MESASSWMLVRFISTEPQRELSYSNISKLFITVIFSMVLCDHQSLILLFVIVWRHHKSCPYKPSNLMDKFYSDFSPDLPFPHLSPSPQPPSSLRYNNIEIRPISNPTMASKCSSERKSHVSHFKSKARND